MISGEEEELIGEIFKDNTCLWIEMFFDGEMEIGSVAWAVEDGRYYLMEKGKS